MGLAMICCAIWVAASAIWARVTRHICWSGWRLTTHPLLARVGRFWLLGLAVLPCALAAAGLISSLIWAFADIWRFPDGLPSRWGLQAWMMTGDALVHAALNSLVLGLAAASVSVFAAVFWLEGVSAQTRTGQIGVVDRSAGTRVEGLIYLPLLIPQAAFLFGLQILLIWLGADGMFLTLLWVHVVFVFPYVMLSLGPSWRRFDTGFTDLAANLGARPWRRFCAVKLPILLIPVLTAFAVGFAVSQALYLPTVFASNGRIATLTTEAVILASGASRQTLGAASFLQMALPLVVFLAAEFIGLARFRRFSWFRV